MTKLFPGVTCSRRDRADRVALSPTDPRGRAAAEA
jgi:hypothetical protein